jgi:23S rRNA (pseudouridine1915-N3)-methyltransferase
MKVAVAAIGRLKAGPERLLAERYIERAGEAGRRLGITLSSREFTESRAGSASVRKDQEAAALLGVPQERAMLVALDERGKSIDSRTFAERLANWRDSGTPSVVFAIGGPDGHGPALIARAGLVLAFGSMAWPHQLVRVMLAEQIYRAMTILAGHPYHRD